MKVSAWLFRLRCQDSERPCSSDDSGEVVRIDRTSIRLNQDGQKVGIQAFDESAEGLASFVIERRVNHELFYRLVTDLLRQLIEERGREVVSDNRSGIDLWLAPTPPHIRPH